MSAKVTLFTRCALRRRRVKAARHSVTGIVSAGVPICADGRLAPLAEALRAGLIEGACVAIITGFTRFGGHLDACAARWIAKRARAAT